jgi:hypothetical protein
MVHTMLVELVVSVMLGATSRICVFLFFYGNTGVVELLKFVEGTTRGQRREGAPDFGPRRLCRQQDGRVFI